MRPTNIIMLASLNKGKVFEFRSLFKEYPEYKLKTIEEIVFNPTALSKVETGTTFYENAFKKCKYAHYAAKYPTISDDSGLEVDALSGKPGVHTDRYAQAKGNENQDQANIRKLLEELKGVPREKRTARFVCTVVFMVEGVVLSATEKLEGLILESPSGNQGFGYDPIFLPQGAEKSLAKMTLEEKNAISHRAKALRSILSQVREKDVKLVHP